MYVQRICLLRILQCVKSFLSGTYSYDIFHIVYEDLTITDIAGIQNTLRGLYHLLYRNGADDDFHLNLRYEHNIQLSTTVLGTNTSLGTTTHNLGHCNTIDIDGIECFLEFVKFILLTDDRYLAELVGGISCFDHLLCRCHRRGCDHILLGTICLLACRCQRNDTTLWYRHGTC